MSSTEAAPSTPLTAAAARWRLAVACRLACVGLGLLLCATVCTPRAEAAPSPRPATFAQYRALLAAKRPFMLEFSATWCGPCGLMRPILDRLEPKWKGRVAFLRFDVDTPDGARLAEMKKVKGLPYFEFVDASGVVTWTHVGTLTAAELEKRLGAINPPGRPAR